MGSSIRYRFTRLTLLYALFAVLAWSGCDDAGPTEPDLDLPEIEGRLIAEGAWAGMEEAGETATAVCLTMVEPDSMARLEVLVIDTLRGSGFVHRSKGTWSYEPPHIQIDLTEGTSEGQAPRVRAELNEPGNMLLLRVDYLQGPKFAMGLYRRDRCTIRLGS